MKLVGRIWGGGFILAHPVCHGRFQRQSLRLSPSDITTQSLVDPVKVCWHVREHTRIVTTDTSEMTSHYWCIYKDDLPKANNANNSSFLVEFHQQRTTGVALEMGIVSRRKVLNAPCTCGSRYRPCTACCHQQSTFSSCTHSMT